VFLRGTLGLASRSVSGISKHSERGFCENSGDCASKSATEITGRVVFHAATLVSETTGLEPELDAALALEHGQRFIKGWSITSASIRRISRPEARRTSSLGPL
jgi:hypothetical protein